MIEMDGEMPFCIDGTEVTLAQYRAFFVDKATRDYGDAAALCGAADLDPIGGLDVSPVEVTYCGARAYCAWAGKRLCTGEYRPASDRDVVGEWVRACSLGGTPWPWGVEPPSAFDGGADAGLRCGDRHNPRPVAQSTACRHAEHAVFDMIGNAREWVATTGEFNEATGVYYAAQRGESEVAYWQPCSFAGLRVEQNTKAGQSSPRAGFRCCADILTR
jgi:formylglycine-generating enzyme required for sulfatase activity